MRVKKSHDGFLGQGSYDEFTEKCSSVGKFLDCEDDTDRMEIMKMRKNHPKLLELKRFC